MNIEINFLIDYVRDILFLVGKGLVCSYVSNVLDVELGYLIYNVIYFL